MNYGKVSISVPWGLPIRVGYRGDWSERSAMKFHEAWSTSVAIGMPGILPNEMAPTLLVIGMNAEDLV